MNKNAVSHRHDVTALEVNSKPRVCLLTTQFLPKFGGIEYSLYYLVRFSSLDIDVLAPKQPDAAEFDEDQQRRIYRYTPIDQSRIPHLVQYLKFLLPRRNFYDVLWFGHHSSSTAGLFLKKLSGKRYVVMFWAMEIEHLAAHAQSSSLKRRLKYRLALAAIKNADRVLAISQWTKDRLLALGIPEDNIILFPLGVDFDRFSQCPNSEQVTRILEHYDDRKLIITVGRLVRRKGHDMVLQALPYVRKTFGDGFQYLVIGDGVERQRLEALAEQLGIQERVSFLGAMSHAQLVPYYHAADIFVMPSRVVEEEQSVEGFGIVFLEANAAGLPVIAGNTGGVPDAVVNEETGFLVNPEDPEEIAAHIVHLLTDNNLRAQMARKGQDWAARHDWRRIAGHLDTILLTR